MRAIEGVIAAAALVFAGAIAAAPARADPYIGEVAIGGLTLLKTHAISMDSEDLYISRDIVRVKYRFTNTTDKPINALVAFPLPDAPRPPCWPDTGGEYELDPSGLQFKTSVDGRPLALKVVQQAIFKGKDVSARLSALHIPLHPFGRDTVTAISSLPDSDRRQLARDRFIYVPEGGPALATLYSLRPAGGGILYSLGAPAGGGGPHWAGLWTVRTTVTSHQTFPPRKTITVEHEYVPRVGEFELEAGSIDEDTNVTWLRDYCISDGWVHSYNKKAYKVPIEDMLGYVLKTGANWKGPIGDFHLVVDKGKPDSLVSFCAEGIKQISPTQYEVRRANFTPKKDLDILFIDWE